MSYPKMAAFYFKATDPEDEDRRCEIMRGALRLTDEERAHIFELLEYNFDCNENPLSRSALRKLKGENHADR